MKKYFVCFCILLQATGWLNISFGQSITTYPTKLIKVDLHYLEFKKQSEYFILGQDFQNIIIKDIYYHKQAKKYIVFGLIDDVNYNENDSYKVKIDIIKEDDSIVYSTFSSQNGVFAISLSKGEKARFNGELYVDLIIK